jgi:NADH-quinone oxidoreductase subunit A
MDLLMAISNGELAITATITGLALVFAALLIAKLIAPRSFSVKKAEPYECGIPTRGKSMIQFKVGYYLFAILFLMFDIGTVFLYPWAVISRSLGVYGLLSIAVFLFILILGLAYAWRKGALQWK